MTILNKSLSQYFGEDLSGKLILVNRAFLGLFSILSVLRKYKKGTKVLYSTTTCASPVYAATYAGLQPVFVDISSKDYLMDEDETLFLIEKFKDELVAVVYIYIFGHTSESVFRIREKCQKYGIYLIEDLAQAFGSCVNDIPTGLIGDFSILSFGHSKQIDAKRGGIIINNIADVIPNEMIVKVLDGISLNTSATDLSSQYGSAFYANRKKALADEKAFSLYANFIESYKDLYFSYGEVNWDLINGKIKSYLEKDATRKRNNIAKRYKDGLSGLSEHIYCPEIREGYSVYRYTIVLKNDGILEDFSEYLRQHGINCSNLYIPINRFYGETGCPQALDFARHCVNLWVEPSIATDDYIYNTLQVIENYYDR